MPKKILLCLSSIFLLFIFCLLLQPSMITAQSSDVGYKEFKLGISKKDVQGFIDTLYKEKSVGLLKNGNIIFKNDENTEALMVFDQNNFLYKIEVEIKFGIAENLKSILEQKYGTSNDFSKEQYFPGDKRYLIAQWLVNNKHKISLYESEYCRSSKLIPCTLNVIYTDTELLKKRLEYEQNYQKTIKEKELKKKYDGF